MAEMTVSDELLRRYAEMVYGDVISNDVRSMARELISLREAARREPVCWMVESLHSGEVRVIETFDTQEIADIHAAMNGGIVTPLIPQPASEKAG